ncbi:MAG: 30S ribosomal protein S7 [Clostridia bacterium]|nr:30S ribosomal protein S7 [Clostridia bacterium]
MMKEGRTVPRRGQISKRDILPDPMYNSKLVTKLINNMMYDGKKGVAQKIVYDAFAIVEQKSGKNALDAFNEALNNVMPELEVKARRIGGSTYQVPMEVRAERKQTLGLRWIRTYSRTRSERTMAEKLAGEILDALNQTGGAFKKKEETHRMAEANKAFAHYRY